MIGRQCSTFIMLVGEEHQQGLDYKPVNTSVTTADERDGLWTRLNEVNGHTGLFNGNISWMITDLAKIGEVNNDRQKGMQAMLYQYDQLHRIVRSRSLAAYAAASGFAARTTSPAAYDEDYTYDPNGNLLTLQRKNEAGAIADDFNYVYYPTTNRLREVVPVTKDKVYSSGPVRTDNIVYRNVTINGSAYVPQGSNVEVKALENILMDPAFESPDGTDFWAHILADEGTYQYDAIGNLILDQSEGVQISWTPYGKVREVHTKGDSIAVYFRYDGTGNRVEKKVVRRDTVSNVAVTRYVRDASGNVMAIYKDTIMTEQPIYGSSRIDQFTGAREEGTRTLGERKFELSNHLDNVLVVITDHAGMEEDSVWAVVMSANDYYPFGLEMQGREYVDTTASYRYGFNGKEKDDDGEFGGTTYDYGFRIYNPSLARFLSVDPLTESYPSLTPYQFASDRPIDGVDLDGLEYSKSTKVDNNGVTQIKVVVKVNPKFNTKTLTTEQQQELLNRTSELFRTIVGSVHDTKRNIQYEGDLVYDPNATIMILMQDAPPIEDNILDGISSGGGVTVNITKYVNGGNIANSKEYNAITNIHEILHEGGLEHPTSPSNEAKDVALEKIDPETIKEDPERFNKFRSTDTTIMPDIYFNIMLYGFKYVDDKKVDDVRGGDENATKVSPDQMKVIIDNINKSK